MQVLNWTKDNLNWITILFSHNIIALRQQASILKVINDRRLQKEVSLLILSELRKLECSMIDLENKFIQTLENETEMLLAGMTELAEKTSKIAKHYPKDSGFQTACRQVYESKRKLTANLGLFERYTEIEASKQFKAMKKSIHELREQITVS